ncbi:hypothetical protein Lumi_097 [Xylophilus phage Lumi]|nr:hypothetical protein Lumi_097 [Xylophilus phage Lumi]
MFYLLLDTRQGIYYQGQSLEEVVAACPHVGFNLVERRAVIHGKLDTIQYSQEYSDHEMRVDMAIRCIRVLLRDYAFVLYSRTIP